MILSCGEIRPAGIAFALSAEKAFRVTALLCILGGGDSLRVLFRLGKIYRKVDFSVLRRNNPADVPDYSVTSDIVRVTTELIEIVGRLLGRFLIKRIKLINNLVRHRHKA